MDIQMNELRIVESELGISVDVIVGAIEDALLHAYQRVPGAVRGARVEMDRNTGKVTVYAPEVDEDGEVIGEFDDTPGDFGRIATATAALWRQAVGFIQAEPINQEFKTFQDTRNSGDFQIAYAGWCADYNEPSAFLNMLKSNNGNNTFRYRSHSYDKLLNETLSADATAAKRAELYRQAEAELDKDSALIPLFYSVRLQLVKPGVSGFSTKDPLANWQVKDWTFKQK